MCVCTPNIRTPFCGKEGCEWPEPRPGGARPSEAATAQLPKPKGTGPDIADLVCKDILARKEMGTAKYGEPLRAFNGRAAMVDAYQEALDLAQYLRQAIEESPRPIHDEFPALDVGWIIRRCDEALSRGVKEGAAAWAEGLRLIRSHAHTCAMEHIRAALRGQGVANA